MTRPFWEKVLVVYFRFTMAWTFLYAASRQVLVPGWSVTGFLTHTKTFHDFFVPLTTPALAPVISFLVAYGHLLIGLSLLVGLLVRVSATFGTLLMLIYWMAHMDWPYIDNANNLLVEYHLVYAGILVYLVMIRAGEICGVDGWLKGRGITKRYPAFAYLL